MDGERVKKVADWGGLLKILIFFNFFEVKNRSMLRAYDSYYSMNQVSSVDSVGLQLYSHEE